MLAGVQRGVEPTLYDEIGRTYSATRVADPIIGAQILHALGDARSVLNVGAGTGSYEPEDREVIALEPALKMICQRRPNSAPVVRGVAEQLPFTDNCFDAVMAILTLHHWTNQSAGLSELKRIARKRLVILTFDPALSDDFWLVRDYFPEVKNVDKAIFLEPQLVADQIDGDRIEKVLIPADCRDGFLCAYWRRPDAYLDPNVRAGISCFPALPTEDLSSGIEALQSDLKSGLWTERNRDLEGLSEKDFGYRLIIAEFS